MSRTRMTRRIATGLAALATIGLWAADVDAGERGDGKRDRRTRAAETKKDAGGDAERTRSTKPVKLYGTRWHRDTDSAIAAAKKAKKPVLLVRMLGELDEKT